MPVLKEIQAPNGVTVTYHMLGNANIDIQLGTIRLHVRSYPNEEACLQGMPHACAFNDLSFATDAIAVGEDGIVAALERALVAQDGGASLNIFYGGIVVKDKNGTLQAAKDRAWSNIKAARAVAELGSFIHEGGRYQADKPRINGAFQLAKLAKDSGASYSETWTLADNTTQTLNADQVISLAVAAWEHASRVHGISRALRERINQAETIEAVNEIRWPA